jgi:TonB family protein
MAFRALLSSQKAETNAAMAAACKSAGIRPEICSDIFSAIEKGKTQAFSCVIADWADQPEASFLLRRARESSPNRDTVAIAIVDREPTAAEIRDNRLDFLVYRPISPEKAQEVLAEACKKMQPVSGGDEAGSSAAVPAVVEPIQAATAATEPVHHEPGKPTNSPEAKPVEAHTSAIETIYIAPDADETTPRKINYGMWVRGALAAMFVFAAAFSLWNSRDALEYLSQTREGRVQVLRESVAAFFYLNNNPALPVTTAASEARQDAYFTREPEATSNTPTQALRVAAPESAITEARMPLPKASDFPQPAPVFAHQDAAPIRREHAAVPESMRNSPPIAPPEVVAVNAAQMMPASAAQSPVMQQTTQQTMQQTSQQSSEPVAVTEETERALLIHTVNPSYPAEALAQKLHGTVVLQVVVARDGGIQDVKMVRGYFVLAQAAIAAVKQWRFQPYMLNGHAAATQTVITVSFSYPPPG